MARTANGSNGYIQKVATLSSPSTATFHFLYRNAGVPANVATNSRVFSLTSNDGDPCDFGFLWNRGGDTNFQSAFNRRSGGAYDFAKIAGGTLSANTWYAIGAIVDSVPNISVWLNGSSSASTGTAAIPSKTAKLANFSYVGQTGEFDAGTLAEVGFWNVALNSTEMAMLGSGLSPLLIRPASLVWYTPLINDVNAWLGGDLATTGTSQFTPHPSATYGHTAKGFRFKAPSPLLLQNNVNFHSTFVGQILGVDGFTNNVNFQSLFQSIGAVQNNVNFASLFQVAPMLQNNINFQSAFVNRDSFDRFANSIRFGSHFKGDVGALATGRFRGWFYGR